MNELGLSIKLVQGKASIELSHIPFENSAFIWPTNKSDLKLFVDQDGLLVPFELEKSIYSSGDYLIFTDVSGIADDGGWDYVNVEYTNGVVTWELWVNDSLINLSFDLAEYHSEIMRLKDRIKSLPQGIMLEPSQVIFPDD